MPKNSPLILPQADTGEVRFDTDTVRGIVTVSVREPLAVNASTAEIALADFLELAAKMTLESIGFQRQRAAEMMAQLARQKQ